MANFKGFKKGKEKKLPIGITEEFISEIQTLGVVDAKARIVAYQQGIEEAQAFLKCDEEKLAPEQILGANKLKLMREEYAEAAGPTKDAIKALNNKTRHVLKHLRDIGA